MTCSRLLVGALTLTLLASCNSGQRQAAAKAGGEAIEVATRNSDDAAKLLPKQPLPRPSLPRTAGIPLGDAAATPMAVFEGPLRSTVGSGGNPLNRLLLRADATIGEHAHALPQPRALPLPRSSFLASWGFRIATVAVDVRVFIRRIEIGARDPDAAFRRMTGTQAEIAEHWLQTPLERRRMVIGHREDAEAIFAMIDRWWEEEGVVGYFYLQCEERSGELCDDAVVGAFAKTAGSVVLMDSPAGYQSQYVVREIEAVGAFRAGERRAIYLTHDELKYASAFGSVVSATGAWIVISPPTT